MAILKVSSVSPSNISISASTPITFSWQQLGDQEVAFELFIYNISDNSLVYDSTKITTYNTFFVLPSGILTNGSNYKFQIVAYNSVGNSSTSDWYTFNCSSIPTALFTNLTSGDTVYNNSYSLIGSYSQAEGILIKSWQMILYDSYGAMVSTSPLTYTTDSSTILYEFAGFRNNTDYYAELQVRSQKDLLGTTGKVLFHVQYAVPNTYINLTVTPLPTEASNQLQWRVTQMTGDMKNGSYINSEKLDVTNGKVWFNKGFNIFNDFTSKIHIESVTDTLFPINKNSSIVAYNTTPTASNVLWMEDANQSSEQTLFVTASQSEPTASNTLWIQDNSQTPQSLTVSADVDEPTNTNTLWLDLASDDDIENIELVKFKNNLNEDISIRYYNSAFHLYKNDVEVSSLSLSGNSYYLYVQQIGDSLVLNGQVLS